MTIPVWSQAGTAATNAGATSLAVPMPASVVAGEVAFMLVSLIGATSTTISWPAGWNEIVQGTQGGVDCVYGFAWRRLDGSEGGTSPVVNFSATIVGVARIGTVLNARSSGNPFELALETKATSASWDSAAFDTLGPDRLGVILYIMARSIATAPPAGWTERMDSGGGGARVAMDTQALVAQQSVGVGSRVIASDDWATVTLSVPPEPSRAIAVG